MRLTVALGLAAALLGGCGSVADLSYGTPRTAAGAQAEGQAIIADCRRKQALGFFDSYVQTAEECINPGLRDLAIRAGVKHMDLMNFADAYRLRLSRAVDNGELELDEARLLQARLGIEIGREIREREAAAAADRATQTEGWARLLEALAVYQRSVAPTRPPIINCSSVTSGAHTWTQCL